MEEIKDRNKYIVTTIINGKEQLLDLTIKRIWWEDIRGEKPRLVVNFEPIVINYNDNKGEAIG